MISEEKKDAIERLKILCDEVLGQDNCYRYDNYSASEKMTMVSIVLNLIKIQNRMIELMAKEFLIVDSFVGDYDGYTEETLIEYFRNKAKES